MVMLLSMAFLMTVCAAWIALIDLEANILYYYRQYPVENFEEIYSTSSYLSVVRQGVLFICIAAWITWVSIRNVLTLNDGAKAKTLSILTTLGAKKQQQLIFLILDTVILALVSIPSGFLVGIGISTLLLQYLNHAVCARINLPIIPLLQGKPLAYCAMMAALGFFTVLVASVRPALRLIKTPPIEIAKTKDAISVVLRETLFDRIIIRCFGICGKLASANYENYKRRYRMFTRTVSLSTSFFILIVLLVASLMSLKSSVDRVTTENFFKFLPLFRAGSADSLADRRMQHPLCPISEAQARVCPAALRWHQADAALWHGCGGNALLCIPVSVSVDAYHLVGRFAVVYLHWPQ